MNSLVLLISFCGDDCTLGKTQNCTAEDIIFVPKGRDVDDADDFKNALKFLKVLGYVTPGKTLSPGGKKMIREITKGLDNIKKAADKKLIRMNGYSVFVLLKYQECVSGICGNYWKEKTKIVEIDPPKGKRHPIGKKGWRKSVIEKIGKDLKATQKQYKEFRTLAEKKCP